MCELGYSCKELGFVLVYEQEDADDFYVAGRKLAAHIAYFKEKDISIATLQALIRDLLPEHEELQEALSPDQVFSSSYNLQAVKKELLRNAYLLKA